MNSGISDSDSGQNTKMAGLSQNRCPVYRGTGPAPLADETLRQIQALYVIEDKIRGATAG